MATKIMHDKYLTLSKDVVIKILEKGMISKLRKESLDAHGKGCMKVRRWELFPQSFDQHLSRTCSETV